jgi:hypothetical protein
MNFWEDRTTNTGMYTHEYRHLSTRLVEFEVVNRESVLTADPSTRKTWNTISSICGISRAYKREV